MPEGPEVETVKETLKRKILGQKIKAVEVLWPNIVANKTKEEFAKSLKDKEFKDITRRGKFILFDMNDFYLISHLRMEGKYFVKDESVDLTKHDHIVFHLDNNKKLIYNDVRKFGKMHIVTKENLYKEKPLKGLGKDVEDKDFTLDYLKEKLNRNKEIKTLLLDQHIILGIGNIYANEILFASKILPTRLGSSLTDEEIKAIIKNTKKILSDAVKAGGTTIRSYTSDEGVTGRFQQKLYVHGKNNEDCSICKSKIEKITVGGRGTYFCPKCQK